MVGALASPAAALDVPPLTGRIVDNAHLLPADRAASLSAELAAHEVRTGNQVALLTLPSLEGEPLEAFSHRVATTWKLGQKGADNGVLVLVVPGDRKVRIEGGSIGSVMAFVLALSSGLILAIVAAVIVLIVAMALAGMAGGGRSSPRGFSGWGGGSFGEFSGGGGFGGGFGGGGGGFGGGGASGSW